MRNQVKIRLLFLAVFIIGLSETFAQAVAQNAEAIKVTAVYNSSTEQHLFQLEQDTIPMGWTTFRFVNASPAVHFMILEDFPGDRTTEDVEREVGPVFQGAMDLLTEGKTEEGYAKLGDLPAWFSEVVFRGGSGLIMPGAETRFTTYLEPGNYGIECYVKAEDGTFHSMMGMFEDLYVTEQDSGNPEPADPTLDVYTTNEGFNIGGEFKAGKNLVAVHFDEEREGMTGKDVHIVKVEEGTNLEEVATWMDWSQPKGLISGHMGNSPVPTQFLGGTQEGPEGATYYFHIDLEPGKYAMVAEMPANAPAYKVFEVKEEQ
ncbi:hypothetical protein [Salegentibacter chungangensis]|uniref:Uncharacterized protein n=1 Tax=Salegentibacter chungangensis TaxID=1335724 RepID=A0ABW3NRH7_9FLAO